MLRVYICPYNTTQPLRFSSVAGCALPTMYGGPFDASYYGKSKGWAHLIQGKRQFEECTPAQKAESRTWARQSQNKERKRGPRVLPKRGGRRSSKAFLFFFCYPGFLLASLGVKIGPIARLPGKGGLKGRRCLHCLNVDGLNFLEIPQVFSLHVG